MFSVFGNRAGFYKVAVTLYIIVACICVVKADPGSIEMPGQGLLSSFDSGSESEAAMTLSDLSYAYEYAHGGGGDYVVDDFSDIVEIEQITPQMQVGYDLIICDGYMGGYYGNSAYFFLVKEKNEWKAYITNDSNSTNFWEIELPSKAFDGKGRMKDGVKVDFCVDDENGDAFLLGVETANGKRYLTYYSGNFDSGFSEGPTLKLDEDENTVLDDVRHVYVWSQGIIKSNHVIYTFSSSDITKEKTDIRW